MMVAFDGSPDSVNAAKRATALAKEFGASLKVVHAYSIPALAYGGAGPMPVVDVKSLEESARAKAQQVLEEGRAICEEKGVTPKTEIIEASSTVQALVECASKEDIDLIVIGTRGMTGFKKLLLGSVSGGVVTHAHCSVLVVR